MSRQAYFRSDPNGREHNGAIYVRRLKTPPFDAYQDSGYNLIILSAVKNEMRINMLAHLET